MMETPKKKKYDTVPHRSLLRRHYPLVAVIVMVITLISYGKITVGLFNLELSTTLYPLLGTGYLLKAILLLFIFPIILFVLLLGIFARTVSSERIIVTMVSDFIAFLLVGFAGILVLTLIFFTGEDRYSRRDSLTVNNQGYALASRNTYDDLGYGDFILYECDNQVLFCSKIYETNWGYDTSYPAELAFDDTTQEISLVINGEVAHTHPLEDQ